MTQIPPKNIFLSEQILQKSDSKVGSEFVHPNEFVHPTYKLYSTYYMYEKCFRIYVKYSVCRCMICMLTKCYINYEIIYQLKGALAIRNHNGFITKDHKTFCGSLLPDRPLHVYDVIFYLTYRQHANDTYHST